MSNFAERLAARAGGADPGLAVLAPRPTSRFETSQSGDLEVGDGFIVGNPPPGDNVGAPMAPPAEERPPAAATLFEHPQAVEELGDQQRTPSRTPDFPLERPDRLEAARADPATSDQANRPSHIPKQVRAETVITRDETISRQAPADGEGKRRIEPPPVAAAMIETREKMGEAPISIAAPRRRETIAAWDQAESPAPDPQITIGKIEVQFLPQEPRPAAARAAPERTRGFVAYARARRGQPR